MVTGEYRYSLDEKGRLMIPAKIRTEMSGNMLVLTRGIDRCLWLFPPDEWKLISGKLLESFSIFQKKARLIHRRIIAPAQETEIDRTGRITIPQTLREYAELNKDCIIIGMLKRLEIWDEEIYKSYNDINEEEFQEAAEEIGNGLKIL
jgi:MraZ protein